MKIFKVLLHGMNPEFIEAEGYRKDGEQYVFESKGDTEVQFIRCDAVVGIVEVTESERWRARRVIR